MKSAAKVSILLNIGLLGGLIYSLNERHPVFGPTEPATQAVASAMPVASPAPMAEAATRVEPAPFRWSQLNSSDYHVYVKNLRAVGCPEPTLRAIVTSDVNSVYQIFQDQLEQKLSAVENGSWTNQLSSSGFEPALREALQRIPDEETAKIADLLGLKPAPEVVASARTAAVSLPLVLEDADLSALNLNADQKQLIASLRQEFWQEVGGPNQDPNDPAYLARLEKVRPEMDNILKGMIGTAKYQDYQLQAANVHAGSAEQ